MIIIHTKLYFKGIIYVKENNNYNVNGGVLLTTSLEAKARCGFFAGILKNQQNLRVLTYGDTKNGPNIYRKIKNGYSSKDYGICDADFFWAPKKTYGYGWYSHKKIPQYNKNQKVKISAFTTTCKKLDSRDITCSSLWWFAL